MAEKNDKGNVVLKLVVVLAVVAAAVWLAMNSFRTTATVATVTRGAAVDIVTGSVIVHAAGDLKELKTEAEGRVVSCDALVTGTPFKKGAELVVLDSEDLRREMKVDEDNYNAVVERKKIELTNDPRMQLAQRTFDEAKRVHDRHESSDVDFDRALNVFNKAKNDIQLDDFDAKQRKITFDNDQAKKKRLLDQMTIHAPADGVPDGVLVYPGAVVGKGATVATYYSTERTIVAKVSEDNSSKLAVGQRAKVRLLNYGSKEFDATVTQILPYADAETQQYTAYLEIDPKQLPPENLKPFSTGEVTITVGEHPDEPLVDRRALFSGVDGYYVLVVKDGRVEKRRVETGFIGLNKAEIKKFLAPGELVIVSDLEQFRGGQHVRTTPSAN